MTNEDIEYFSRWFLDVQSGSFIAKSYKKNMLYKGASEKGELVGCFPFEESGGSFLFSFDVSIARASES